MLILNYKNVCFDLYFYYFIKTNKILIINLLEIVFLNYVLIFFDNIEIIIIYDLFVFIYKYSIYYL